MQIFNQQQFNTVFRRLWKTLIWPIFSPTSLLLFGSQVWHVVSLKSTTSSLKSSTVILQVYVRLRSYMWDPALPDWLFLAPITAETQIWGKNYGANSKVETWKSETWKSEARKSEARKS
jgi:hypothetical protein